MSLASLADAVAVAMKQWSAQHGAFTIERLF
jgi:glutamine synthetase type III